MQKLKEAITSLNDHHTQFTLDISPQMSFDQLIEQIKLCVIKSEF